MSRTSPSPNKRRRPSRRRWLSDQVKRAAAQALRAKLARPRAVTYVLDRTLRGMGQSQGHHAVMGNIPRAWR